MHHKRRRAKSRRAGCTCGGKLYKHNGVKGHLDGRTMQEKRAAVSEKEQSQ